jgi:hypothetical protein
MFNIINENSPRILNYDSIIAIVLYGDSINSELINQSLEICHEKFKSHQNITYFYDIKNTSLWENLSQVGYKKRKFEIDNKTEFNYVIAINIKEIHLLTMLSFQDIKYSDFSLYYFLGFYNNSSYKTSVTGAGFHCISRIFDLASKFFEVKEKIIKLANDDKSFGEDSTEHAFYYYLKTLNLKTYCANPLLFKEIKK